MEPMNPGLMSIAECQSYLEGCFQSDLHRICTALSLPTSRQNYKTGRLYHLRNETLRQRIISYAQNTVGASGRVREVITQHRAGTLAKPDTGTGGEAPAAISTEALAATIQQLLDKRTPEFAAALREDVVKALARTTEELVAAAVAKLRPVEVQVIVDGKKVRKVNMGTGPLPAVFKDILHYASKRKNIMLVGPSGCGKSYIAERVAEALGLSFFSVSCSAGMSESQLAGWLLPTGESGRFEYKPSPFVRAYEGGGVLLLDEMDSADPNTMTFINAALSNGSFFVPQRFEEPRIRRHKDFICIGAANTWGTGQDEVYVGRNRLDGATLDRFQVAKIYMDYDPTVEEALVRPDILAWGRKVREAVREHRLQQVVSTRFLRDLTDVCTDAEHDTQKFWEDRLFQGWSKDEADRVRQEVQRV